MTSADLRTAFFGAAGALIVLVTFVAIDAVADSDPAVDTVPRVIPYDGVLELDGGAYTGAISMRFTLYDNTDSTTGWTETYTLDGDAAAQVDVYNGTFTVLLGQHVAIDGAILRAEELFIGVEVSACSSGCAEGDWIELVGRQMLGVAPFALWSVQASDLHVAGSLTVDGAAVGPQLTLSNTVSDGGFDSYDDFQVLFFDGASPERSYGIAVEANTLAFNSDREFDFNLGGVNELNFSSTLLTYNGNADINGTVSATGVTLDNDGDITGADQIVGYDDLRFYGNAGTEDMTIAADGSVTVHSGNLGVGSFAFQQVAANGITCDSACQAVSLNCLAAVQTSGPFYRVCSEDRWSKQCLCYGWPS